MTIEDLMEKRLLIRLQLDDEDYKIIKAYEYQLVNKQNLILYNMQELHERREKLRDEINLIDQEIAQLQEGA